MLKDCGRRWPPERRCPVAEFETRHFAADGVEIRAGENGRRVLTGYAARYNVWSHDLGGFVERIRPGAFARALAERQDVVFVRDHDPRQLMARSRSGTLRLSEDAVGLRFEADLPDTQLASDTLALVERGDLSEMSFKFRTKRDEWDHTDPERSKRELIDVDLLDVSVVLDGAYPDTTVAARSLEEARRAAEPSGMAVGLAEAVWAAGE